MSRLVSTVLLCLALVPAAKAQSWRLVSTDSDLTFKVTQMGSTMDGRFGRFTADIDFDETDLDPAKARVVIDMASADVNNAQGNRILKGEAWFNIAEHPRSVFETQQIRATEAGYEADATLTIKGKSVPLTLPFELEIDGDRAHMTAETTLDRTRFDIGGGDADETVGETVTVRIDVIAERQ